jgi:hypothetical protein
VANHFFPMRRRIVGRRQRVIFRMRPSKIA